MPDYTSYIARIVKDDLGPMVRLIERYYPGPPGPDYRKIVDLSPADAIMLGHDLIAVGEAARLRDEANKLERKIRDRTRDTAQEAKKEAES